MVTTTVEIELPEEWGEQYDETQCGSAIVPYQHEAVAETTFIVSVLPRTANGGGYKLWLSTINPTSTPVRHDYPVDEYDSLDGAVDGAESFIAQFSQRVRDGAISTVDPKIEAIRETIQTFTGDRLFPSFRRLLRRFR